MSNQPSQRGPWWLIGLTVSAIGLVCGGAALLTMHSHSLVSHWLIWSELGCGVTATICLWMWMVSGERR